MTTVKEKAWLEQYFVTWNATESARRAGYKWPNKVGPAKLKKFAPEIQARLDEMKLDADEVLRRLGEQARADYAAYVKVDDTGKILSVDLERLIDDNMAHLIKGFQYTKHGLKVEFYDSQAALALLGRHHKLFTDKIEHGIDLDTILAAFSKVDPQLVEDMKEELSKD